MKPAELQHLMARAVNNGRVIAALETATAALAEALSASGGSDFSLWADALRELETEVINLRRDSWYELDRKAKAGAPWKAKKKVKK